MAKITTLETRYAIKQMIEAGQSIKSIAQAQEISCSTVKKWHRRIREERLESRIGRPPRGALSSFDPEIRNTLSIITVNPLNACDDRSRLEAEGSHIKP